MVRLEVVGYPFDYIAWNEAQYNAPAFCSNGKFHVERRSV